MFIVTRLTALLSIGLLFVLLATSPVQAAEPDLAALKAALADGRAAVLADQVRLPFLFEGRSEGRDGFVSRVAPQLFTPAVRRCLAHAKPRHEDGRLVLDCPPYAFYLDRDTRGRWRIAEFGADGEG